MASMSRIPLSASSSVYSWLSVGTSSATVHIAVSDSSYDDDVWLDAFNTTAAPIRLTLTYGGVSFLVDIPPAGSVGTRVFDGLPTANSGVLAASAASAGLALRGWVNRHKAR